MSHYYFLNNSVKNEPTLMIFGVSNQEKIPHEKIIKLPPHM